MTSINAIRFNSKAGAMVFDEVRGWNPMSMFIQSAQKMKPVVPEEITVHTGLVAGYGNTGTSAIGDELRFTIRKRIQQKWDQEIEKKGEKPKHLMTIEDIANMTYELICELKHKHTNELLKGRYSFDTDEFIQGSYELNNEKIEIKDKKIVESAENAITWKDRGAIARPVFGNAGIVGGYDPVEGFRIFHLSIMEQICVPVQELFVADGSGRDQCELIFSDFAAQKSIPERMDNIDPVEGLFHALKAIVISSRRNLGVGGYSNIMLFDGNREGEEKMRVIFDNRARLATEILKAFLGNFITYEKALSLIDKLCFKDVSWNQVHSELLENATDSNKLRFYLRGYGYKE